MVNKKFIVRLSGEERERLDKLISKGKASAKIVLKARILLKADAADGGPAWADETHLPRPSTANVTTVERVRQRFVERGARRRPWAARSATAPADERKLDGEAEARLIALACSAPPEGRAALDDATAGRPAGRTGGRRDCASDETVRRVLKKTSSSRG